MRNDRGQFLPKPDSLHPKQVSVRIHKSLYPLLVALAATKGESIVATAREILELALLQQQWQVSVPPTEEDRSLDGTIVTVEKVDGSIAVCQTAEGESVEVAIEWLKPV